MQQVVMFSAETCYHISELAPCGSTVDEAIHLHLFAEISRFLRIFKTAWGFVISFAFINTAINGGWSLVIFVLYRKSSITMLSKGLTKLLFQLFLSFPTVVFLSYWQLLDGGEPRFSLMDFLYIFFIRSTRHQKLPNTVVHTKVDRSL